MPILANDDNNQSMLCRSTDQEFVVLGVTGARKSSMISSFTAELGDGLKPGKLKSLRWKSLISIKS